MATDCTSNNFANDTVLRFGRDRIAIAASSLTLSTSDGPNNTARTLIDQTLDWTHPGPDPVLAHILFERPPRYVRAQGPYQHWIDEEWAVTTNGAAPALTGSTAMTRFGGGPTRNQSNYFWQHLESGAVFMPSHTTQVARTTGQQLRIRYQARLSISAAGGSQMDVRAYWHRIWIVTTPLPI